MSEDQRTRQGYLLLADISGYTAFLAGTELEHANAIVHELTTLIRERLSPPMRFVKLEGDAVFCYADAPSFEDGERLVELIESCYFDFSNRLLDMERATTCRCAACASIGSLDLKFVAHYGTYVIESEGDREDLAGADVILVHRLLKNTVGEGGGRRPTPSSPNPACSACPHRSSCPRTANPTSRSARRRAASTTSSGSLPGCAKPAASTSARRMPTWRSALASILIPRRLSGSTSSIPRNGCVGNRCRPRSRTSPTAKEDSGLAPQATAPTGSGATRCASTSTGARSATSPTASRPWVAGRCSSPASRPSSSPLPTEERGSTTGSDSKAADH